MKFEYFSDDLITALATPPGRGALAVIRVSGPGCIDKLSLVFSNGGKLKQSKGYRIHYGWFTDGTDRVDEVLISVFREPNSYTGQDSAEISCHGGPAVVEKILNVLRKNGFRDASPGEFSFRAFSNGKMDLTRAEAVNEIIDARTDKARALAVSRLNGSIENTVNRIKDMVKHQAAAAALALDYPEEEAEPVSFNLKEIRNAEESIETLLKTWNIGRIFHDGISITLAGPANAGKSSLFNLFLKEERSIVTEKPGTTRDWVESWINIGGIPVKISDTAGIRKNTDDPIEIEGIRRTMDLLKSSDIIIAVADGSAGKEVAERLAEEELSFTGKNQHLVKVWNKSDLVPKVPEGWIGVSALNGSGFDLLEKEIQEITVGRGFSSGSDAPVIDSVRQKRLLEKSLSALERLRKGITDNPRVPVDLLAEDLYEALDALGELTGEVTRADILETLFSDFCVGK